MKNVFLLLVAAAPMASSAAMARSMPVLKFRGGVLPAAAIILSATPAQAAKGAAELVNCVGGANGFFGNVRVPAALLAGAALGQLWSAPDSKRGPWVKPAFTLAVAMTVLCEFLVILISTAASTHLMTGAFNPMATSTMAFMMREMELHFVACRFNVCRISWSRPPLGLVE